MTKEYRSRLKDTGKRVDVFLAWNYPEFTRSSLERLFDAGHVEINKKRAKPSHKLKPRDLITVDETKLKATPPLINLPVIFENDDVIVINKPEGVLTHSKGAINDEATVASFARSLVDKELTGNRAGIVHRLDRATSGLIIVARNTGTLKFLQKQFSQRRTKKTYMAVVEGVPPESEAIIDVPLARNPKRPQTFRVDPAGKTAQTHYRTLETFIHGGKSYALLELIPVTGRTHQLRVHLSYIKHPIAGDRLYGREKDHLYLHAKKLKVTLPGGERKVFEAQEPFYFKEFINDQ